MGGQTVTNTVACKFNSLRLFVELDAASTVVVENREVQKKEIK